MFPEPGCKITPYLLFIFPSVSNNPPLPSNKRLERRNLTTYFLIISKNINWSLKIRHCSYSSHMSATRPASRVFLTKVVVAASIATPPGIAPSRESIVAWSTSWSTPRSWSRFFNISGVMSEISARRLVSISASLSIAVSSSSLSRPE